MARGEMLMVFCYDIADDRRRRRVAKILEESMVRVQESVFESHLGPRAVDRLARLLEAELGPGDDLRIYGIGRAGLRRSRALGGAPISEAASYWLL